MGSLCPFLLLSMGKSTQAVEAPPPVPGAAAHLHLKGQTQNGAFLLTLKK